jgi:hypothetical protein
MTYSQDEFFMMLASHQITRRWVAYLLGGWWGAIISAAVTIPLKYPYQAAGQVIDTGAVVGLVLPLAITSRCLDEGPPQLIATAARSLCWLRLMWATGFLGTVGVFAALMAILTPVPWGVLVGDAYLLAGLSLWGVATLGASLGWLAPLAAALVASAPGFVPWQWNILYRRDDLTDLAMVSTLVTIARYMCLPQMGITRPQRG